MVNIYQHTQYCEGRGYVNPNSLKDAMAKERGDKRVMADNLGLMQQLAQNAQQKSAFQQVNFQQSLAQQPPAPQTLGQRVAQFIAQATANTAQLARQLIQVPAQLLANLGQQLQNLPGMLSRMTAQIGAFFFNTKESRNEKDEEVKKKRDESDVANADMFEINTIKEPSQSAGS